MLHRAKQGCTPGPTYGNAWGFSSVWVRLQEVTVLVVSLYIKVDESLLAGTNRDTITELMSLLGCTNAAWIVGADWNHSLEELHDLQLDRACQGDFVVPEGPTISTGSRIDYFLVSKSLVNKSRAAVHHTVPWKPHYAVMRSLDLRPEVLSLPSLERFGRIPCCHGPRLPWSAFQKASSKCRSGHISVIVTMSSTTCSRSSSPSLKPGCCPRSPTLLTLG